jgi:hypothetical protein
MGRRRDPEAFERRQAPRTRQIVTPIPLGATVLALFVPLTLGSCANRPPED